MEEHWIPYLLRRIDKVEQRFRVIEAHPQFALFTQQEPRFADRAVQMKSTFESFRESVRSNDPMLDNLEALTQFNSNLEILINHLQALEGHLGIRTVETRPN